MPLFLATPYRIVRPEPRLDPMSKQMVMDPPFRVYTKRDEAELFQAWSQSDPDIIEVPESHAQAVLRRQKGYQEIPVKQFEAQRAAKVQRANAARNKAKSTRKPATNVPDNSGS